MRSKEIIRFDLITVTLFLEANIGPWAGIGASSCSFIATVDTFVGKTLLGKFKLPQKRLNFALL